jgi:exopolysaccharide biosynthesis polyprenyl glycosylphosphotransferase
VTDSQSRSAEPSRPLNPSERPAAGHLLAHLELPRPYPQRERGRDRAHRRALLGADALALAASALVALAAAGERVTLALALYLLVFAGLATLAGLYDRDGLVISRDVLEEVPSLVQLSGIAALSLWLLEDLAWSTDLGGGPVALLWALSAVGLVIGRVAARAALRRLLQPERCLVIGDDPEAELLTNRLASSRRLNAEVVLHLPLSQEGRGQERWLVRGSSLEDLVAKNAVERVIVAPGAEGSGDAVLDVVRKLEAAGMRVSVVPRLLDVVGPSMQLDDLDGIRLVGVAPYGLSRRAAFVKRSFDFVVAIALLAVFSPLFLAVAIAIKVSSPGPVFFRQLRTGRDGRPFRMIKFRTMQQDAEARKEELLELNEAASLFKISNDPRVTPVGRWLRKTSVDELAQLLDVARGTMSLVGPRPFVIDEESLFEGWHRWRYHLRPGMTGPWQILGSTRIPLDEMVKLDYLYCADWTLWGDVKILVRTAAYLLRRESGEHISAKR